MYLAKINIRLFSVVLVRFTFNCGDTEQFS